MTKSFTTRLASLTLAAASVLAISGPALAQGADQGASVRVSYSDLDIGHAQGLATLKSRVEAAAVQACGGSVDNRDLDRRAIVNQCRTEAVGHAMSQLGVSQVADAGRIGSGR